MPEYLAPGVYVEETSFRSKSIEGVSTTTTGFVGPTLYGPIDDLPELLTSLPEFEQTYGGREPLRFQDGQGDVADQKAADAQSVTEIPNFMWHAVRAFFDNGGARLYVKRVFSDYRIGAAPAAPAGGGAPPPDTRPWAGKAGTTIGRSAANKNDGLRVEARYPGTLGARRVRIGLQLGQNKLSITTSGANTVYSLNGLTKTDVVLVTTKDGKWFAWLDSTPKPDGNPLWSFEGAQDAGKAGAGPVPKLISDLKPSDSVAVVTATVSDLPRTGDGIVLFGLPLDPAHAVNDQKDSLLMRLADDPPRQSDRSAIPVVIRAEAALTDLSGMSVLQTLLIAADDQKPTGAAAKTKDKFDGWLVDQLMTADSTPIERSFTIELIGGSDGRLPTPSDYEGAARLDSTERTGLASFEDLEDISIVAAPGAMFGYNDDADRADQINQSLISHCERMRYRIAVLDSGNGQTISQIRAMRARIDSKHAAIYYPWVVAIDPQSQRETALPPSGFVAGIYARNDRLRAVYKAPANEVVTGALGFETMLNRSQQEVLNPEGINCFRFFEGRGNRLWGARTVSSDPEWKYVNLRRYFAYLERSIDVGTQWAVFEPNGEMLWANVRRTIEDFLFNECQMGALLGDKPEKAFFVRCDRSTMTQNDLDNGRLVCLIGVAALRPAEFVIFRIGQWTADRRV